MGILRKRCRESTRKTFQWSFKAGNRKILVDGLDPSSKEAKRRIEWFSTGC